MRVAPMAEPAPIVAERDPPVPMVVNGDAAESPYAIRTRSIGIPSSSAATCASVVSWPWPCGTCQVVTVRSPVGSSRAHAVSLGMSKPTDGEKSAGPGAGSMYVEKPTPR